MVYKAGLVSLFMNALFLDALFLLPANMSVWNLEMLMVLIIINL